MAGPTSAAPACSAAAPGRFGGSTTPGAPWAIRALGRSDWGPSNAVTTSASATTAVGCGATPSAWSHPTTNGYSSIGDGLHAPRNEREWNHAHGACWCAVLTPLEQKTCPLLWERPPAPLWLAWLGGPLPDDLLLVWRWYQRRFTVEHGLRFSKQTLGWTTVRPRDPAAADRWTWLLAIACWQLWLARAALADTRLPWETPCAPERLSPGRVRRAFAGLLAPLGTPARSPKPRGKSPGRRLGESTGPAPRFTVVRRTPKRPKKRLAAAA